MVCALIIEGSLSRAEKIYRRGQDGRDLFRRRMTIDPFITQTGGEAINAPAININEQLAHLIDRLRSRYTLGFSPKREQTDERYHQIRVVLTSESQKRLGDVVVRSKQGYFSRPLNR